MPRKTRILIAVAAALHFSPLSHADIVWSDDFTGLADGASPSRDFTNNGTNDWMSQSGDATMIRISSGIGNPGPSLLFDDANNTNLSVPRLEMSQFAPFSTANPATPLLRLSFDWQVESFVSAATNANFRVILRANNSTASGNQMVFGFNRGSLNDGDGLGDDLALYAGSPSGTSNFPPSDTAAIGLIPGVGWQPGFDFGQYSATGAENDTDDLFYRFELTYDFNTGALDGIVTRLAEDATNGQSTTFTRSMSAGLVFSNTDSGDVILLASTNDTVGVSRFDNFVVESVPEPATAATLLLGLATVAVRRRQRIK